MKDGQFRKYLYISLAGAIGIILCIIFFFAMFRFGQMMNHLRVLRNILTPFIYGAVIAYLLAPVCNFVETHLNDLLSKKMKNSQKVERLSWAAGIAFAMIFGICIIYLLLSMVLPQVFTSIRGIVAVLPSNVNKWMLWLEQLLADNEVLSNYV